MDNVFFFKKEELYFKNSTRIAGRLEFQNYEDAYAAYLCAKKIFKYSTLKENSAGGVDLFYSNKKEALLNLIFHTRRVEKSDIESIKITGRLLGYPACCIDAYIKDRLYLSRIIGLNWLIRRVEQKESFPSFINPFNSSIRHIPCKLNCKQTIRDTKLIQKIFLGKIQDDNKCSFITPLPFNLSPDDGICIKDFIPILISDIRKNRIQYTIYKDATIPDTMKIFKDGNTIIFENGFITLKYNDILLRRLALRYIVWSRDVLPEREFYHNLFKAALYHKFSNISSIYSLSFFVDKEYQILFKKVEIALKHLSNKMDIKCSTPEIFNNMIRFSVVYNMKKFNIIVQLNRDVKNYYLKGKDISICIEGEDIGDCDKIKDFFIYLLNAIENRTLINK